MDNLRKSTKPQGCGLFYSRLPRTDKMNFIKTVVFVYDTLTLPIYYIIQRPWKKNSKKTKTKLVEEGDLGVSLVRIGSQPGCHLDDYNTVDQAMMAVCAKFASKPCFGVRETLFEEEITSGEGKLLKKKILAPSYQWVTYSQIDKTIDDFMRGMLTFGITPGSKVVIFSETRMEWMIAFHGLLRINCAIVTLYANLGKEGIVHVLNQVEAEYVIVSSDVLVKLKQLRAELKFAKKLVVLESKASPVDLSSGLDGYQVISYNQLINQGSQASPGLKGKPSAPDDIALIMYTSGSTGVPKGVQISHRNFMSSVRSMNTIVDQYTQRGGTYIAYLPLAHIYECVVENCMMMMGHGVGYSSPFTLTNNSPAVKEGVQGDLPTLKPRVLCGVPLVLDRIRKEVTKTVEAKGGLAAKLFYFGLDYKNYWLEKGYQTPIMDRLVFKRTIEALGGDCKIIISGGAPLSIETQYFARACFSVDLIVGYSATECCCAGTCMDLGDTSLGNVGYPLYGIRIRLAPWEEGGYRPDDKPNPRGEILIGGDNVALGYYKNEEETRASFKEENGSRWFYTGDIGEILPNGGIKIIDRRKDLVKLQFGEYVSLGKVEAALVGNPLIDFICIYGDSLHNYIVALIVPNHHSLKSLAKKIHPDLESWPIGDLCENPKVIDQVLKEIEAFSLKIGLIKYEIPRRIKLCKEEWTPDSGLVTAAMKIRRNELKKYYNEDIKRMYTDYNVDQNQNMRKI